MIENKWYKDYYLEGNLREWSLSLYRNESKLFNILKSNNPNERFTSKSIFKPLIT